MSEAASEPMGDDFYDAEFDTAAEMEAPMDAGETGVVDQVSLNSQQTEMVQERLIIRDASLSLLVEDTEAAMRSIAEMAESNGGWVVSSNVFQYREDSKTGTITVRVPATGFNSALEAMKRLAVEVVNESTSGQDVTDEFVDLSLRLENLEATADRVRSFLDEAETVEEALAVNSELSRLEGQIEQIKGRMEFLSQSATYSTITVELTPDIVSQPIEVLGWRPSETARRALNELVDAGQGFVDFLIWFGIVILPIGLLYGIPLYLIGRFVRRRWWLPRRNRRADAADDATTD